MTIKHSFPTVTRVLSPNYVLSALPLFSIRVFPSIARLLPLVMVMCLPTAVSESFSEISLLLSCSSFESGFAFFGQGWTDYEAVGDAFCHRVSFCVIPLVEILLSLAVVMFLPPAFNESSSTTSLLLMRAGFKSGFSFVGQACTIDEDIGVAFFHRVPFQGCLVVHTFLFL